jgi:hypothetical protein
MNAHHRLGSSTQVVIVLLGLSIVAQPTAAQKKTNSTPRWEQETVSPIGKWPDFKVGKGKCIHVWYESNAWHFRCTSGIVARSVDGIIKLDKGQLEVIGGDGRLEERNAKGKLKNANQADYIQLTPQGLAFRFNVTARSLDGLDFVAPKQATSIHFDFEMDGDKQADYIFIGAKGEHPRKPAFSLPAHPR